MRTIKGPKPHAFYRWLIRTYFREPQLPITRTAFNDFATRAREDDVFPKYARGYYHIFKHLVNTEATDEEIAVFNQLYTQYDEYVKSNPQRVEVEVSEYFRKGSI